MLLGMCAPREEEGVVREREREKEGERRRGGEEGWKEDMTEGNGGEIDPCCLQSHSLSHGARALSTGRAHGRSDTAVAM